MIADRKINFKYKLESKIYPDGQTCDAVYQISIDTMDTMICKQKSVKN